MSPSGSDGRTAGVLSWLQPSGRHEQARLGGRTGDGTPTTLTGRPGCLTSGSASALARQDMAIALAIGGIRTRHTRVRSASRNQAGTRSSIGRIQRQLHIPQTPGRQHRDSSMRWRVRSGVRLALAAGDVAARNSQFREEEA